MKTDLYVKKSLIPLLAIFFIGILAVAYFYMQKQKEYKTSDHFLAIPASSEIMIHFDNIEDLVSKLGKIKVYGRNFVSSIRLVE